MTDALSILIADDEAPARSRLRDLLDDIESVNVIAEAKNGKEAIQLATALQPDVMLLDIRMPLMNGIETAQHAQKLEPKPSIIFTTAYDDYAIKAFDLNAIDYLLKPIRLARLQTALEKTHALKAKQISVLKPLQNSLSHLSIHERGRIILVPIEDIIYCRAELKNITVRTTDNEYLLEESLTHLEAEFSETFLRLHRNCLAAKRYITGYEKMVDEKNNLQWHALLKGVPETIAISRRQLHLVRQT